MQDVVLAIVDDVNVGKAELVLLAHKVAEQVRIFRPDVQAEARGARRESDAGGPLPLPRHRHWMRWCAPSHKLPKVHNWLVEHTPLRVMATRITP